MGKKNIFCIIIICCFVATCSMFGIRKSIQQLPAGFYLQSCKKCFVVAGTLRCQCHAGDEEWTSETLENSKTCRYDLVNDHGNLTCIPFGPYLNTCARCWMSGDTLYCRACKNIRGRPVQLLPPYFSLPHVSECRYDIVNNNAELNCLPQGPYLRHCSKCRIKDGILQCQCSLTPHKKWTLHPTSIDLATCPGGSIFYFGGILECIK